MIDPEELEHQKKDMEEFGDEETAPDPDIEQSDEDTPANDEIPEELL